MNPGHSDGIAGTTPEDLKNSIDTLLEINAAIARMDSSIRTRAFDLLCSLHLPGRERCLREVTDAPRPSPAQDPTPFVDRYRSAVPAENVYVLVAWAFLQHGHTSLSLRQIRELAIITATSIPKRPDNTMRYARHGSHPLFERSAGVWLLTIHGQTHFREKFPIIG